MKELLQLCVFFCIYSLVIDLRGTDAGCVVPDVPHSSRSSTDARVNSHQSVTYTCVTPPYIHIYGSLTITCSDREDVFDKEPPVCGIPEYVLYVYEKRSVSGGTPKIFLSLSRCLQACKDDPTCEAVDWDGKLCWFHDSSTSCNRSRFVTNVCHYQMKQCPGYPAYNCPACSIGGTCVRPYTSETQVSTEECVCNLGRTGDQCSDYVKCNAQTFPNTAPSPATGYRFGSNITFTCNRTCEILPVVDHLRQVTKRSVIFEGQTVTYTCNTGFQFNGTSTVMILNCRSDGTFDKSLPSCVPSVIQRKEVTPEALTVIQRKEVTPEALTEQVPVAVAISGWIATALVLVLVGVIVVVIRRNPVSQPFADTDHSDTSELHQNSWSPPDSVDREHEYMSLEANAMATDDNVVGYANVNDSAYTDLGMPANDSNQQQPTAAGIHQD